MVVVTFQLHVMLLDKESYRKKLQMNGRIGQKDSGNEGQGTAKKKKKKEQKGKWLGKKNLGLGVFSWFSS